MSNYKELEYPDLKGQESPKKFADTRKKMAKEDEAISWGKKEF